MHNNQILTKRTKDMKKIIYAFGLIVCFSLTSCDTGFDAMNKSKIAINELEPAPLLNNALYWTSPYYISTVAGVMNFEMPIVQQAKTPFGSSLIGGNYNQENFGMSNRHWTSHYGNVIKETVDIIQIRGDDPNYANIVNMARIIRAYSGMILADTYGEVPFSEAGLGFHQGISQPKYDTVEEIYNEVLKELEEATAALSASGKVEASEVLYAGNITKWKRFGYSLMLRAAMRVSEVAPGKTQEYVNKAIAGGLMQSTDDNAMIRHNTAYPNTFGETLQARESANYYIAKPFIDHLRNTNDPRIKISVRHIGAVNGGQQTEARRSRNPEDQIGFPMGYDNSSIAARAQADGVGNMYAYSQFDRTTIAWIDVPFMMVTYSQTQFMLVEAVERGFASGVSATHYENAIRANFSDLQTHGYLNFTSGEINDFVSTRLAEYLASTQKRRLLGEQFWVANFNNPMENWANYRRTGYPILTPNPYPLSDIPVGEFIRRYRYPAGNDYNNNAENLATAIGRQGPDVMNTRIWWDTVLAWEP